jgi:tetratricopeptide (TPR) repeat protein
MKISKSIYQLIVFLLPIFVFGQASFDKANELYIQENYAEAAKAYEEILTTDQHSVELYFNLANAYYKLNAIAPAIYYYEKALLIEPNNKDVRNNLKFAQNMTIDEIVVISKVGLSEWIQDFTSVYHYNVWAKIAIGFSFLVLLAFIGYYFISRIILKRLFFGLAILFIIGSAITVMIAVFERNQNEKYNPAIVFVESVALTGEPKSDAKTLVIIHEGTKVILLETLDDYYKVKLLNGTEGWLLKNAVKALK